MDGKYTRLKLKMLLLVVLGTLIAGGVGIFLLEVVVDGVLQDPFARFFLWAATTLFGQSPEGAAELYQRYIRNNKQEILTLGTMLLMLIAFYLARPPAGWWRPRRSRWSCPGSWPPSKRI